MVLAQQAGLFWVQLLDPEGLQRFPLSTPAQRLPRVVALAPGLAPQTADEEDFRQLNVRLAQVRARVQGVEHTTLHTAAASAHRLPFLR